MTFNASIWRPLTLSVAHSIFIYYSTNKLSRILAHPYVHTPIMPHIITNAYTAFTSSTLTDEIFDDPIHPTATIDNRSEPTLRTKFFEIVDSNRCQMIVK